MLRTVALFTLIFASFAGSVSAADRILGNRMNANAEYKFPESKMVVDITKPPYGAKGDGTTDDTAAFQKAILDIVGAHKILYIPNGTYLISKSIRWAKKNSQNADAWGFTWIQGQSTTKTILKLKDNTFTNAEKGESVMWCGGFGSADWFHNYIQNLTIDTGKGNSGAIGLQFYSNNIGAVRDVVIRSGDGQGLIGLDLGHRDMNGPLLARNITVEDTRPHPMCRGGQQPDLGTHHAHQSNPGGSAEPGSVDLGPGAQDHRPRDCPGVKRLCRDPGGRVPVHR